MTDLTTFKINGTTPFWSPGDVADTCLSQAYALLALLAGANEVCDSVRDEPCEHGEPFDNLCHSTHARGLDGIATLIAFAQFNTDAAREKRAPAPAQTDDESDTLDQWAQAVTRYLEAKQAAERHSADVTSRSPAFGTPENVADEETTERLADEQANAFDALMLTPAPNRKALAFKTSALSTFLGGDEWHNSAQIIEQIAADAARLAD